VRRDRRGFTVVETVAAVVILAIAIPPMLWSLSESHHQRINPILFSKAGWLATEKLEDIIADRHSVSGNRGYDFIDDANAEYDDENMGDISGFPQFSRQVAIVETQADLATAGGGYKTVTVTVGWNDANGAPRTLSVVTVVTEYDPV
jgi:type II secretory pathway pseudopilin PulG